MWFCPVCISIVQCDGMNLFLDKVDFFCISLRVFLVDIPVHVVDFAVVIIIVIL